MTAIDKKAVENKEKKGAPRHTGGGVYLIVADETPEFELAMKFAARMAKKDGGHIAVLYAWDKQSFQHWGVIEKKIRHEQREEAERFVTRVGEKIQEFNGLIPSLYVEEGNLQDILVRVIDENMNIKMLVLGAGTHASGPGPLVAHFTTKGLTRLHVPVLLIPDHLDIQRQV